MFILSWASNWLKQGMASIFFRLSSANTNGESSSSSIVYSVFSSGSWNTQ